MSNRGYRPSPQDPVLILAMDHRESFGRTLFGVRDDRPDADQRAAMEAAKRLIYAGLARARGQLPGGRAGVLVDERYTYDRDLRPGLVTQVIADNQAAGVEPAIWKVEGLETAGAARAIVVQIRAGGRDNVDAIVLGRDARTARLNHWLAVAAPIDGFVGFAIGRSIWEEPIASHNTGSADGDQVAGQIAERYLDFAAFRGPVKTEGGAESPNQASWPKGTMAGS